MYALKFSQTGSLEQLKISEVADPVPQAGEVLVRVHAAACWEKYMKQRCREMLWLRCQKTFHLHKQQ